MSWKLGLLGLLPPLLLALVLRSGDPTYPHAGLLIEPSQLARRDALRQAVVLDVRERSKYEQGHVPGARWVDPAAWTAAFGHGTDGPEWSRRIGDLGIRAESRVVVYDDNSSKDAAHVWWVLRYWNVEDVRVLNGGWTGWTAGAYPTAPGIIVPLPVEFVAHPRTERIASREQLLGSLHDGGLQIVDARSEAEYRGIEKLSNRRSGAIPGAKHLEWIDLVDRQTHRFKTPVELRAAFTAAGIALDRPTAIYCQCGVRSALLAFVLELMGARDVRNYHPGWAEWSEARDTPVAAGPAGE